MGMRRLPSNPVDTLSPPCSKSPAIRPASSANGISGWVTAKLVSISMPKSNPALWKSASTIATSSRPPWTASRACGSKTTAWSVSIPPTPFRSAISKKSARNRPASNARIFSNSKPTNSGGIHNGISRIGYQSGGKSARFIDEELPDTVVAKSAAFIGDHKDKPFFLLVGLFEPHVPRTTKPEFAGSSGTGLRGDVIQQADWQVGRILEALEKNGLSDDTIVVLTSDNGPVLFDDYQDRSVEDLKTHSPAGPWSGGKYLVKEGGCRVPFIIRWPAKIKPGIRHEMLGLTDMLATMASLTGQKVPEKLLTDSIDQLPTFLGTTEKPTRTSVVLQGISGSIALRDGNWKLIKSNASQSINDMGSGAKSTDPRFALAITQSDQLFNLAEDPGENHNVATRFPERLEAMKEKLQSIQSR